MADSRDSWHGPQQEFIDPLLMEGGGVEGEAIVPRKRQGDDDEEEAEGGEEDGEREVAESPAKKKKKRRSEEREEVAEEDSRGETEQERRRREMLRKIDAAAKGPKKRPRKRADETDLEQVADDEVVRMRDLMQAAASEDQEANLEKKPATAKLRMLKEAVETLQK